MGGTRRMLPLAGRATCALIAVAAVAWTLGLGAVTAIAGVAAFATAAAVAGADSRTGGDWSATRRR